MSSLNALKYNIEVKSSYYAGAVVLLLYFFVILFSLSVIPISLLSIIIYLFLFSIALYAAKQSACAQGELLVSESGLVESRADDRCFKGKIATNSIYNRFFILLKLDGDSVVFAQKKDKKYMLIYKDAINDEQYRLLARLINSGRV